MRYLTLIAGGVCAALVLGSAASAQQGAAPAQPPSWPSPGPAISLDQATKAVEAAMAKGKTTPYQYAFAVVGPTGNLIYFEIQDGALTAAGEIAINKARTAATFSRPTKVFFDAVEAGHQFVTTLAPYIVASPGGLPLIADGKVIGAIGVSGGPNGLIDQAAAQAGVDALK
jgi:glc operon protein GlcG